MSEKKEKKSPVKKKRRLTTKQKLFIKYIKEGMTGKDAVIKAGYNLGKLGGENHSHTSEVIASENLSKPEIRAKLQEIEREVWDSIRREAKNDHDTLLFLRDNSDDDKLRADIANKNLDRAGYKPVEKRQTMSMTMDISNIPSPESEK